MLSRIIPENPDTQKKDRYLSIAVSERPSTRALFSMAERVGFEPTEAINLT